MTKLLAVVFLCTAAFLFRSWIVPASVAAFLMLLHAPREIGFGRLLAAVKPLPLFVALIVLAHIFLIHRALPWWEGAASGLVQSLRVVALVVAGSLFLAVTDPVDLSDALLRLLAPLQRFGLRVGELSLMTMITFSFVPLLAGEARRLQLAHAVRCGFPRRGIAEIKALLSLLPPLVIGVFRRSAEIDDALKARGYRLGAPRGSRLQSRFGWLDAAVCAGSAILFLAGLYAEL